MRHIILCCFFAALAVVAFSVASVAAEQEVSDVEYVEPSFVELESQGLASAEFTAEAAAMSNTLAAGVGEGSPCAHDAKAGTCTAGACHGTSVSGLCAGNASVRCCIGPNAARAPLLPVKGARCKAFGAAGTCAESSTCKGRSYYGFCAGSASVKCCVPAVTRSTYSATATTIKSTTAARLAEAAHQAKWKRFKAIHNKKYSSAAVEAQRYAQFKRNRQSIVAKNDRVNRGVAVYMSTSPFADMDPAAFARFYLGTKTSVARARAMMEMGATKASEAERILSKQSGSETLMTEADAGADEATNEFLEMESEMDLEIEAEMESEMDSEMDVEAGGPACSVSLATGTKQGSCIDENNCGGKAYSGYCSGPSNIKCCVPAGPVAPSGPVAPPNDGYVPAALKKVGGILTIDYRNILTPFKNQQSCGSCWAFAATETYETSGVRAGVFDKNAIFAPQQVVDCATDVAHGCDGGGPSSGLSFYQATNATLENSYPYKAVTGTCNANAPAGGPKLTSYDSATNVCDTADGPCPNHKSLKNALEKYGPLVAAVDASQWMFYNGGIFPDSDCNGNMDHAVQVVGYGTEVNAKTGVEQGFFVIRNSWGTNWGEGGFIRVQASFGANATSTSGCSIANAAYYAVF